MIDLLVLYSKEALFHDITNDGGLKPLIMDEVNRFTNPAFVNSGIDNLKINIVEIRAVSDVIGVRTHYTGSRTHFFA